MLSRVLFVCLLSLSLDSAASSLSCRWMDHKFRQHSEESLDLLDTMANNSTNTTEDAEVDTVIFPNELYNQAATASDEDKLRFTVQVLNETAVLFEEDQSSASWEEKTGDDFVNVATRLADGLRSCVSPSVGHKKNKKLHMYFKRLSNHILKKMGHSAAAWELIRREIKNHLMRADHLISPLLPNN